MLLLTAREIDGLFTMEEAIATAEEAFRELALGRACMPHKAMLSIAGDESHYFAMPAYLSRSQALATKIVSSYQNNPERFGLPRIIGAIVLNDAATGAPVALMDANSITGIRTGAGAGAAVKALARTDARIAAVVGCGVEGRSNLMAARAVRDITTARVYAPNGERREEFAGRMSRELEIDVRAVSSVQEAVEGADVVLGASSASAPVIKGAWLSAGSHVSSIGRYELDPEAVARSLLVVDTRETALGSAPDIMQAIRDGLIGPDHIHAELGEVLAGLRPGRTDRAQITAFKSLGIAAQDATAAARVYQLARERGIGTDVDI